MLTPSSETPSLTTSGENMERTPHCHRAAAREFVNAAELTTLQVNPKNGAKSIAFRRPIRVRMGGRDRDTALRAPFGGPKSFDPTKVDRLSFSVCVAPDSPEAQYADLLDTKAKALLKARLGEFMPGTTAARIDEDWKPIKKEPRSEDYWPTISVKVQATGANPTRIWIEGQQVKAEDVPWSHCRVAIVCQARSLWVQPKMYGVSLEARDIVVYPEYNNNPDELDSEEDEE